MEGMVVHSYINFKVLLIIKALKMHMNNLSPDID
jgi:hypothetical protein